MKLLISIASLFLSLSLFATHDLSGNVTIVVNDSERDGYTTQKMPYLGCSAMSLLDLPLVMTSEFIVPNIGCGLSGSQNINALTCAKITFDNFDEIFNGSPDVKGISVDISGCLPNLENSEQAFKKAVTEAVAVSFGISEAQVSFK